MIEKLVENVKDRYLTWHTGQDRATREYYAWEEQNIVHRASYVRNYFQGFTHIIALDYHKVYNKFSPFWNDHFPSEEFLSYVWPNRPLGENCAYSVFRGEWNQWDGEFHIHDFGDRDQLFVATNNEDDAIMLALRYS